MLQLIAKLQTFNHNILFNTRWQYFHLPQQNQQSCHSIQTLWSSRTRQLPYSHVKMTFVFNNYVNIVQYWTYMYIAASKKVSPDKALDKAIVRILSQQCVKEHCNHRNVPLQQSCGIVTWKSLARKNPRRMKHMMNRTKTIKVHVKVSAVSPKDKTDRTHC